MIPITAHYTRTNLETQRDETCVKHAQAVPIAPSMLLTTAHVLTMAGWTRTALKMGHRELAVVASDELALLEIQQHGDTPFPALEPVAHWTFPDVPVVHGQTVQHWYRDTRKAGLMSRSVTWSDDGHVPDGFEEGWSGSGLFVDGKLFALAEQTNGWTIGPLSLTAFLREWLAGGRARPPAG